MNQTIYITFIIFLPYFLCSQGPLSKINEIELALDTEDLVKHYGYPFEEHTFETTDGYTVKIFRIPHGQNQKETNSKPMFLMHGLVGSPENFLIAARYNSSLAFLLADNGYDVWLGNARGNSKSRHHIKYQVNESEFWNYDWHEIAMYDVRGSIDYILEETKKPKISYMGHSQGGTTFCVLMSENPEYNDKINIGILMAPAIYNHYPNAGLKSASRHINFLKNLFLGLGYLTIPPMQSNGDNYELRDLCENDDFFKQMCKKMFKFITETNSSHFDSDLLPMMLKYVQPCAIRQFEHFSQEILSSKFRKFDFNTTENMEKYGVPEPPEYQISNIKVPVALFYGKNDDLSNYKDIEDLAQDLPNCVSKYLMPDPKWTHMDFLVATDGNKLLFNTILDVLNKYNK